MSDFRNSGDLYPAVDIIIPVYRDMEVTRACIESVLASDLPENSHIIVIDDASPEPELADYCQQLAGLDKLEVIAHSSNRGFVASVNEGMKRHLDRDIVLLNSDTRVAGDWLQRLRAAAWSEEKVASVTPFSNNASLCSFPNPVQSNELPAGINLQELDQIFARSNPDQTIELPTAVGFCMYIRRDCIDVVGYFDETSFGRGYGEENDFSRRAAEAGWKNLLAADVFVWHQGSVSFGDDRHELMQRGGAILSARYPDYDAQVRSFYNADPLKPYRQRVQTVLLQQQLQNFASASVPRFLFISHAWGGGVEQHIQDLISGLNAESAAVMVLRGKGQGRVEVAVCEASGKRWCFQVDDFGENIPAWIEALKALSFSRVHLHHIHGWQSSLLTLLAALDAPLDITLHDYWCVSPHYHLSPLSGRELASVQEAAVNQADWPLADNVDWAEIFRPLLLSAARVIAPSGDVAARVQDRFPQLQISVEAHPEKVLKIPALTKVCLMGALSPAKGLRAFESVVDHVEREHLPLFFHLIGHGADPLPGSISFTGSYQPGELGKLLAQAAPDVIWLPSQVHETWSYTLSAALQYGKPIVAADVGAFRERLAGVSNAVIVPANSSPADWAQALLEAVKKPGVLQPALTPRSLEDYFGFYWQAPVSQTPGDLTLCAQLLLGSGAKKNDPEKPLLPLFDVGVYGGHKESLVEVRRRLSFLPEGEVHVAAKSVADRDAARLREVSDRLSEQLRIAEEYRVRYENAAQQLHRAQDALRQYAESLEREQRGHADSRDALKQYRETLEQVQRSLTSAQDTAQHYEQLLEERSAALEERTEQFNAIIASTSWRITRPIRVMVRAVRKSKAIIYRGLALLRSPSAFKRILRLYRRGGTAAIRERLGQEVRTAVVSSPPPRQDHVETHLLQAKQVSFSPLTLLTSDEPQVSIVIPVYGQHDTTYNCLASIAANPPSVPYEVIVADDASPQSAAEALAVVQGVRIIRHPANLGFLGNVNAGTAQAKGEWLIILNNDTLVCHKAFDALLQTFANHSNVGLVGAKLLNADGSVQEAGGIIWRDGSGWNWGRNQHRDDPRFNYVRDVDYCSGAVLAIRRSLFESMGGFDTHFAPAYYEDTDLAFRVREQGLRVLYQPAAEVYHLEGVSHGRDINSGMKAYQVVNAEKFYQRWQATLANHRENAHEAEQEAHRNTRGNVLVIEACMITPDQDSGSVRMLNLLDLLRSEGYHVTFVADNLEYVEKYVNQLQQRGIEVYHGDWANGTAKNVIKQLGPQLDAVFVCRHYILQSYMEVLRELAPRAKIIFDTVDLHFVREEREAALYNNAALQRASQATRRQELGLIAKSDVTVVVSEFEKKLLADLLPQARVEIISNIHNHEPCRPGYEEREGLIFVGGFRHPPNVDAITWFAKEVAPLLRELLPGVTTKIIGSNMPDSVRELAAPDLEVVGFVENLDPILQRARISIAPLRYGAGVKGKVNEAMNYGIPVVATACAVEGMHLRAGEEVMVAETAREFAEALVAVYQNPGLWQQLSQAGVENVRRHFSPAAARPALQSILQ